MSQAASRTALLVTAALTGFAANSLLCRQALASRSIDPATFTSVRLTSGAITLALLLRASRSTAASEGGWRAALLLFSYAGAFSYAYLKLSTGTGALILFGVVQATMIGWGLFRGERLGWGVWAGLAVALSGLVTLTLPGLSAPDPKGAALMALAGVSWGAYSLLGRGSTNALAATAGAFARSVPMALALSALTLAGAHATTKGVLLAVASGALASGIGYSLWYAALPHLPASRAAIAQLFVPVLAAAGGVVLLGEKVTTRLLGATALVLIGVGVAVLRPRRP